MSTIILIAGPESTATRFFTETFSQHPLVSGTSDKQHSDILDSVWESGEWPQIKTPYVVTRRSIPHGMKGNAEYMVFPEFEAFLQSANENGHEVIVLIPTRSTIPHLMSWAKNRASVNGSWKKTLNQYHAAYKSVMEFCFKNDLEWWFLSIEAFILHPQEYIQSLFIHLGMDQAPIRVDIKDPNLKQYQDYFKHLCQSQTTAS